ncbi:Mrp/NBP35 family ATP-binding protein [Sedimentisphaera salicampi]|uniref:Mrp/NBP35 family ATP-binding protein n=1 Tax=Sedimentisphaera salicampi TaxID=1941349 RepID=UPI000B9A9389|nr:Mrp/NBP35 family ATP-binding protein [Sedimentisphaera salicampi]OXU14710.1 Cell division inhibitor MinD [Sedimentisphaera salicampi]
MAENQCSGCSQSGSCPSANAGGDAGQSSSEIGKKIIVMSGKGGVGKSSVAANLAAWLSSQGNSVGLLDVDLHGPSIPRMMNVTGEDIHQVGEMIIPAAGPSGLKVMSIGFLLESDTTPVIWRGPAKHNVINQFVNQVHWGKLDYLIVDCPPGTGDEPLSAVQTLEKPDGAIIVTTPQQVSVMDVRRCISFCGKVEVDVLGVLENMAGYVCPKCGYRVDVFLSGGGEKVAEEFGLPFLGSVPMDPEFAISGEQGKPIVLQGEKSPTAQALAASFSKIKF